MIVPNASWTHMVTEHNITHHSVAFLQGEGFYVQVTHKTRFTTLVQVREAGSPEGFDFQNTGSVIEWGFHAGPDEAFRFAEAYVARTEDFRPAKPRGLSERYRAAIDEAYAPGLNTRYAR